MRARARASVERSTRSGDEHCHVRHDDYVLGRTPAEYERLRAQARVWEAATGAAARPGRARRRARAAWTPAAGPGETMRLMAQRVGPAGTSAASTSTPRSARQAVRMLHAAGHHQCAFEPADARGRRTIPGAPFDLVYARLLLFHVADPVAVLRRLWDWVAPGGHLVVQDYDLRTCDVLPALDDDRRVQARRAGGVRRRRRDIRAGHRLPLLFADAGIGAPDGTDVAGRLEPLAQRRARCSPPSTAACCPAPCRCGLTTQERAPRWLDDLARDAREHGEHAALWPLMIGAWKRKAA